MNSSVAFLFYSDHLLVYPSYIPHFTGIIMGIRHKTLPIEGVQFHPESICTEEGHRILQNFLNM